MKSRSSPILRGRLSSSTAIGLLFAALGSPASADPLPTGGQVVSGSAAIATSGTATTITQNSDKAIVNWNGFSIGQGMAVNFIQPGASSTILNRVTGSTTSTIAGSLTANGQVYLINPNGIAITPTGAVKVGGGFVASTLDISNEDFLKGQYNFIGNGASTSVSNKGVISVGRGGYAALIGGTVRNDGLIAVPVGRVGLGSGEQATLDLSGDGFLQVAVPTKDGAEGKRALIENGGKITAEGGTVVMRAATARNAARHAINLSGVVEANSISGSNGSITIGGDDGGHVTLSGKVKATSISGKGGKITVTGKSIVLKGATVDASGAKGGGTVKIGGDKQGKGTTQRAETTSIDATTTIRADATGKGNGGSVVVWSDYLTTFAGLITAMGAGTGTGGDAEVSGKALLDYIGFTNLSGPGGFGTLLLDPYNLTISSASSSGLSGFNANANDSVLDVTTLTNALATANVAVSTGSGGSQAGNITVATPISWSSNTTLTLSAYGNITVNANLTGGSGSSIVLRADNSGTGTGTVSFGTGITATASGGVSLYYNPTGNNNTSVNSASYWTPTNYSANAGTSTTITAYMLVNTLYDLQNIQNSLSGTYALGRDIDASATASWNSGAGFNPLGSFSNDGAGPRFFGTFNGDGHTITGLTINRPTTNYVGLFGFADIGSAIRNVGLEGGSVTGYYYTGQLVGRNSGAITNAYATGAVTGSGDVGGLVGMNTGAISNVYATGAVTGDSTIGGLIGLNGGTIDNAYATGAVTDVSWDGGGLIGSNLGTATASFFDLDTTGKIQGVGSGSQSGITGLTTAVARASSSYTDWDFSSVWYQSGDIRPILRSEAAAPVNGVITVSNLHQLALIGANLSGSYVLKVNIDASATGSSNASAIWSSGGFAPIGDNASDDSRTRFAGTFDGNGHTITGLTINRPGTNHIGLFGWTDTGSVIRNVGLVNASISGQSEVGALVGTNDGSISNVYTTGVVTGSLYDVGGLVGSNVGTISNAYATSAVTSSGSYVGGLVGTNWAAITNAYATGSVNGSSHVGGLVGDNQSGTISVAYATGAVTSTNNHVGGLAGNNSSGTISNVYATGPVVGGWQVGGLVGTNFSGTINNAYTLGTVNGHGASGIAGENSGTIAASFFVSTTDQSDTGNGAGLTVSQMKNPLTFINAGWDFSTIWGKSTTDANGGNMMLRGLSSGLYDDYVAVSGSTVRTYGDVSPLVSGITVTGFGSSNVTLGWSPNIDQTTPAGLYDLAGDAILSVADKSGRSAYVDYGMVALTVNARPITITPDTKTMTYGDAIPGLTYTVGGSGLVNGETLSGELATTATSTSNVGSYGIGQGTLSASSNYAVTYLPGQLTVTPATLTVMAGNGGMVYGDSVSSLGYAVSGWRNGQTDGLLSGILLSANATSTSNAGSGYVTTASGGTLSGAATGNYRLDYVNGSFSVTPRPITVSADAASMVYGNSVPRLGYRVTKGELVNADTLSGALATSASSRAKVGTYEIAIGSLGNSNYTLSYIGNTLTITPATLAVMAANATMIKGTVLPNLGYSVSGWKNGQDDRLLSGIRVTTDATTASLPGRYSTVASGGLLSGDAFGNYTIAYVDGSFTVISAPRTTNPFATSMPLFREGLGQVTTVPTMTSQGGIPGTVTINGWDPAINLVLTQEPNLAGATCKLGPNLTVSC